MLFNSLTFLIFFVIFYVIYIKSRHKQQNALLLIASYIFYGSWDYRFLSLILLSTIVDFFLGKLLVSRPEHKKRWLLLSVTVNLSILGFFKYFGFFADSLVDLAAIFNIQLSGTTLDIILPVGISFYTFQTMSYTIDIYRGKLKPTTRLLDFAVFVAFFPQLVAGPIERAVSFLPQISKTRIINQEQFEQGCWLIFWGLFKKMVIADNLAAIVNPIYSSPHLYSGSDILLATIAFAFQIFCDFSGYSDIARGLAKLMGIELMVNFKMPYFSTNPQQFWNRWHISLSSWLRDYLYISLGGNRQGNVKAYRNLLLTMLLGGLWHGAAWNFILWGAYQGIILVIHRFYLNNLYTPMLFLARFKYLIHGIKVGFFFMVTCYGWLLFRAESYSDIVYMTSQLTSLSINEHTVKLLAGILFFATPLVVYQLFKEKYDDLYIILKAPQLFKTLVFSVLLTFILASGLESGSEFIYFQF